MPWRFRGVTAGKISKPGNKSLKTFMRPGLPSIQRILENARVVNGKPKKQEDKNQKMFSEIIILLYGAVKLTIGKQKNTGEYIQYCITVPGSRMHKK